MNCPGNGCTWKNTSEALIHLDFVVDRIQDLNPDIINFCEVEGCDELNILKDEKTIIICDECQTLHTLFARTFCITNLLLNKKDLDTLKYFKKSNQKLYLEDDIQNLIKIKYGNEYINYKQQKILYKYKRLTNKNNIIEERRKILLEKLADYKIECKKFGDCYSYIELGKYKNIFSNQQIEPNTYIEENIISF
jgi:hypothetical protein